MSRAFVKETDGDGPDELPDLPVSRHPNYVTGRGLRQLQTRLTAIEQRMATLSHDAVDSRLQRAQLARDRRWLLARLAAAQPVPSTAKTRIDFGARVELADDNDQHYRYRIVGEDEADPEHGRISWLSPLAQALKDAQVGDSVIWQRPAGDISVEVLAIDFSPESPSNDLDVAS